MSNRAAAVVDFFAFVLLLKTWNKQVREEILLRKTIDTISVPYANAYIGHMNMCINWCYECCWVIWLHEYLHFGNKIEIERRHSFGIIRYRSIQFITNIFIKILNYMQSLVLCLIRDIQNANILKWNTEDKCANCLGLSWW